MKVILIRHGKTEGNLTKRYIGRTDEKLCSTGIEELMQYKEYYPNTDSLISSPMLRCIETAQILYPTLNPIIIDSLKECDFGIFENKNYLELQDEPLYQQWIDSGGKKEFPDGESFEIFTSRCVQGFDLAIDNLLREGKKQAVFIVHGGTIMSVLNQYSRPHKDYYCWQISNSCGYLGKINEKLWIKGIKEISNITSLF